MRDRFWNPFSREVRRGWRCPASYGDPGNALRLGQESKSRERSCFAGFNPGLGSFSSRIFDCKPHTGVFKAGVVVPYPGSPKNVSVRLLRGLGPGFSPPAPPCFACFFFSAFSMPPVFPPSRVEGEKSRRDPLAGNRYFFPGKRSGP